MATPTILDTIPSTSLMHNAENATSLSFTYTVPSGGSNTMLVVMSNINAGDISSLTAISQNGTSMLGNVVYEFGGTLVGLWYSFLAAPTTGTFSMSLSSAQYFNPVVFTIQDCAQASPVDITGEQTSTASTTLSETVATNVGNDLLTAYYHLGSNRTITGYGTGEAQVSDGTSAGFGAHMYASYEAAASSAGNETVNMTSGTSGTQDMIVIAWKFQAPPAGASPHLPYLTSLGVGQ